MVWRDDCGSLSGPLSVTAESQGRIETLYRILFCMQGCALKHPTVFQRLDSSTHSAGNIPNCWIRSRKFKLCTTDCSAEVLFGDQSWNCGDLAIVLFASSLASPNHPEPEVRPKLIGLETLEPVWQAKIVYFLRKADRWTPDLYSSVGWCINNTVVFRSEWLPQNQF